MNSATRGKLAVFRCDGGTGIGLGHVMRCLALAEALEKEDWACHFAVSPETAALGMLAQASFDVITLPSPMDPSCLLDAVSGPVDLLVVDHYRLDHAYESRVHEAARILLALDDLPVRKHRCDILLDAGFDRTPDDYAGLLPAHCRMMSGPQYVLLRRPFAARRERILEARKVGGDVKRVFVCFGGDDSQGLCLQGLRALEALSGFFRVDVVISSGASHLEEIRQYASRSHHEISVNTDCTNVGALLECAHVALGASGLNAWERCAFGVPSVMVCAAQNQKPFFEALIREGAAIGIEDTSEKMEIPFADAIGRLLADPHLRGDMSRKAAALCDGQGAHRAAAAIMSTEEQHAVPL